ncbi:hypothetical protein PoB_002536900, partial [Plakobranchus ocellatus]
MKRLGESSPPPTLFPAHLFISSHDRSPRISGYEDAPRLRLVMNSVPLNWSRSGVFSPLLGVSGLALVSCLDAPILIFMASQVDEECLQVLVNRRSPGSHRELCLKESGLTASVAVLLVCTPSLDPPRRTWEPKQ